MPQSFPSATGGPIESPLTIRLLRWLDEVAIRQHRHPIGFFGSVQRKGFWRCGWPYRVGLIGICLGLIGLIGWLVEPTARLWVILTPLLLLFGLTGVIGLLTIPTGTLTTATAWLSFWYLYGLSAPFLCLLLLSALAVFSGPAFVLGLLIGLPIFLVFMAVDAGALLVHLAARRAEKKRDQFRLGGPVARQLEIGRQGLIFWLRLSSAALFLLAGVAVLLVNGMDGWQGALFLVVAAAASLRSEAILLALAGLPLAWFDKEHRRWRAAYCGRNALLLPGQTLLRHLRQADRPSYQSSILLALLVEGAAAPSIGRGLSRLDDAEVEDILLHLSLRAGACDALRLLARHLPEAQAKLAESYALLAEEAAKPPDLQRWLLLLTGLSGPGREERVNRVWPLLFQARSAFSSYRHSPQIEQALSGLQSFVAKLEEESTGENGEALDAGIWPGALLRHLQIHRRTLAQGKPNLSTGERQ